MKESSGAQGNAELEPRIGEDGGVRVFHVCRTGEKKQRTKVKRTMGRRSGDISREKRLLGELNREGTVEEEERKDKAKWKRNERRGKDEGGKKEIGHIKGSLGHGSWYLTQIHIFHSDGLAT